MTGTHTHGWFVLIYLYVFLNHCVLLLLYPMNHFFEAADAFLAEGFVLGVEAVAFFGLGAFGFFVGGLAVFLAFGALLAAAALALAPDFLAAAAGFFFAAAAALFSFTETAAVAATEDLPFDGD
ncbi:hypothetical protein FEC35_19070, partial [Acinetobacter baumannii]